MHFRKIRLGQRRNLSFVIPQLDYYSEIQNAPVRRKVSRFEVTTLSDVSIVSQNGSQRFIGEHFHPQTITHRLSSDSLAESRFTVECDDKIQVKYSNDHFIFRTHSFVIYLL